MPTLETLTEADLRGSLNTKSLRKARAYLNRVQNPIRAGHTLKAQVRGTRLYNVELDVESSGIHALCSCPYNWGGYCKHIGAVLLKWIQAPDSFTVTEVSPPVRDYPIETTPIEPSPTYRPKEMPFWLTLSFPDRQHLDTQQLEQWFDKIKIQDLRQIAKKRGWQVKGNKKAAIVQQMSDYLTNPADIRQAISSLDHEHRQVLRALLLVGGQEGNRPEDLERVATSWGPLKSHKQITTYTRHLWEAGLALSNEVIDAHTIQTDFIPRAMGRQFPPLLAEAIPATTDLQADHPASELRFTDPYALIRTVNQIALLLEQSPIALRTPMPRPRLEKFHPGLTEWDYDPDELLQAQREKKLQPYSDLVLTVPPPARSLMDKAIEWLAPIAGDEARLEFIFSLLVACGLFQPGSPVTTWPEVKEQFLRHDELTQRAILSQVYFRMSNWSELWEVLRNQQNQPPADRLSLKRAWNNPYFKPMQLNADLARFRLLVLRVLACLPDGKWVMLDDLLGLMGHTWLHFDQSPWQTYWYTPQKPGWFLAKGESQQPLNPKDTQAWALAQGSFIRYLITGPLYWLGLADLSFNEGLLTAVRLHGLADLYWDRIEVPPAPDHAVTQAATAPPAEAVATDEYRITVNPTAISAQAHSLLDKIARLEVMEPERFVYRLEAQAAHASFEAGLALSEVIEGWEQHLAIPMPETIHSKLSEWWQAYGQVRIYEDVTIIEFGDDYALAEMKAVTSLENYLIAEISPRLVLIPQDAVPFLTAELEKAGYTPKQTEGV